MKLMSVDEYESVELFSSWIVWIMRVELSFLSQYSKYSESELLQLKSNINTMH